MSEDLRVCVVGLGYVGLPLATAFSSRFRVKGFDISGARIGELRSGFDRTFELSTEEFQTAIGNGLEFTSDLDEIKSCNFFIVTVPTPVDEYKSPDLRPLIAASETIGRVLKKGDIVVYESTVYPGATEEDCVPVLERFSGLRFNIDFFCGYSPERINPGDKEHTVQHIKKITSGSTPEVAIRIDAVYGSIITAGTHLAPSIKVAEAAKVIENAQRDINIAFINELAILFNRMGIDTESVLKAAETKWNFLPFRPGLVGGHCIGVDPYYLTHKAQQIGYHPEIILSGRRLNDNMGQYVAGQIIKCMIRKGLRVLDARVLMLGITFKENCPDIRNSRVIDVVRELQDYGCHIDVYDPWADADEVMHEYGLQLLSAPAFTDYSAIVLGVAHKQFQDLQLSRNSGRVIYDVKSFLDREVVDGRL